MKRRQYDRYGGPEVMRLREFEPLRSGPNEVLVHVLAAAAKALDWKMRTGEMRLMTGRSFPREGADFAGWFMRPGNRQDLSAVVGRRRRGDRGGFRRALA